MGHPPRNGQKEHQAFLDKATGHPQAYRGLRMGAEKQVGSGFHPLGYCSGWISYSLWTSVSFPEDAEHEKISHTYYSL